ncbi:MAG: nucleoside deaminase [Ruminococcus sp.]
MDRYDYMSKAIRLAEIAKDKGEIPVGCVIVKDSIIIAEGYNECEAKSCALRHAEIVAIEKASEYLNSKTLAGCELYVTLEPCIMCTGAIINAKISKVVFGAFDINYGACGTAFNLFSSSNIRKPQCFGGIMEQKCSEIISEFFKDIRKSTEGN